MDNVVNVVLATDEGYLKQSFVVMESIMQMAKQSDFYHFYILTNQVVIDSFSEYIQDMEEKYSCCKVEYLLVDNMLGEVFLRMKHITRPTYYRLLLPEILEVDKCIYLDSDIIVLDDLKLLYDIPLEGYEIAGVKAPTYHIMGDREEGYKEESGLLSMDSYINAGVLIINLAELRKSGFTKSAMTLVNAGLPGQDQDIINRLCYGRIKILPFRFNFQPARLELDKEILENLFGINELEEAVRKPAIIHYLTNEKPWECLDIDYADKWWEICKITRFYQEFLGHYKQEFYYYSVIKNIMLWKLPIMSKAWYEEIKKHDEIYVYGAGKIGQAATHKLVSNGVEIKNVLVSKMSDQEKESIEEIPVIEYAGNIKSKAIVIIAVSKRYQLEIRRKLFTDNLHYVLQYSDLD